MSQSKKRPIIIWIIFIWFLVTGISGLYQLYALYSGAIEIPEGMEKPEGIFYYGKALLGVFLSMSAAVLLFLRKAVSRWLFLALFLLTVTTGAYTLFTYKFPADQFTLIKYISIITWIIYGLIVWYVFTLQEDGYFGESNT